MINGKNVAITKDKKSNDWEKKGVIYSLGTKTPINKLFEKSGEGKIKIPPTNPIKMDKYAVFSLRLLS